MKMLAALGMAHDDVAHIEFAEHAGGDAAGESAGGGLVQVLRSQPDVGGVGGGAEHFTDGGQGGIGGTKDDFRGVEPPQVLEKVLNQHAGLGLRFVHFPVTGDDFFAFDHK